jgi:hypothetical protein
MMLRRILLTAFAAATVSYAADPALLNLVMKDPKVVAGIDVDRTKNSPFGQKIMAGFKDDNGDLQSFIAATGFDPRRDLREVIVASQDGQKHGDGLVIAKGTFDAARIASFAQDKGATSTTYQGVQIWHGKDSKDNGAVAFLDGSIAIAGPDPAVRAAIDRKTTGGGLNAEMAAKVARWSSQNDAWFVTTLPVPGAGVANGAAEQGKAMGMNLEAVQEASAGVRFGNVIEVTAEAVARTEKDANALADVVRGLAALVRMNQEKAGPDVMQLLDAMQVTTTGTTTHFSIQVPQDLIEKIMSSHKAPEKVAYRR